MAFEGVLYGCLNDDTSSLDACIPSYLAGYNPSSTSVCTKRVYQRDEVTGKLALKNKANTDRAYIYLSESDKISPDEIRFLHNKHGISELYVYRSTETGKYEHSETLTLTTKKSKVHRSRSSEVGIVLLLLLLFIILLIVAAALIKVS